MEKQKTGPGVGFGMTKAKAKPGRFLRAQRLKCRRSQLDVAKLIGFGFRQTDVSMMELGYRKYLTPQQLNGYAKAINCSPEEIRKHVHEKKLKPKTELYRIVRMVIKKSGLTAEEAVKKLEPIFGSKYCWKAIYKNVISYKRVNLLVKYFGANPAMFSKFFSKGKQPKTRFAKVVRAGRIKKGMSVAELARKLGRSKQFVSQIEHGEISLCRHDEMVEMIAFVLGLDADKLKALRSKGKIEMRRKKKSPHLGQKIK